METHRSTTEGGPTPTAFVVDDDPAIRRMLKRILERELGHVVTELGSGEEALARLDSTVPDLVVVDVNMTGMDGLEVTRRIKALYPRLPVVAVTGVEDQEVVSRMIAAGVSSYVVKGSEPEELVRGLRAAVEGRAFLDQRVTDSTLQELRDLLEQERERAEALTRLDRMKQELISVVAHEFRTPLTVLKAAARLLRADNEKLDDATRAHALEAIETGSDRLSAAVTQLVTVSEIRGGALSLREDVFALQSLASEALERTKTNGREIATDLKKVDAIGDRPRLLQVTRSIIDNAVKFTEGQIRLTTSERDGWAVLEVRDEGPGIEGDVLRRVLEEPLSQGDPSSTRAVDGLGLSLYIGRHVLELSGGRLEIASAPTGTVASLLLSTPGRRAESSGAGS